MDNFLRKEEAFTKELERCINRFKELNKNLEDARKETGRESVVKLKTQRLEVIKSFAEMLKKESEAEHEKSHLLESYGNLILTLDERFTELSDVLHNYGDE